MIQMDGEPASLGSQSNPTRFADHNGLVSDIEIRHEWLSTDTKRSVELLLIVALFGMAFATAIGAPL
jgi:hypothetical protein